MQPSICSKKRPVSWARLANSVLHADLVTFIPLLASTDIATPSEV